MTNTRTRRSDSSRDTRARFWGEHIERCEASGKSIAAYCRSNSLSAPSYYWWKRELKRLAPVSPAPPAAAFAEVHAVPSTVLPPRDDVSAAVEIVLDRGRVARVRPGFDAATLARVLDVLEGRSW